MSGADALYDQRIKALAAREPSPAPERIDASARADNPLCGDRATVTLQIDDGKITGLSHQVRGCLICRAAANVAAGSVPGMTTETAKEMGRILKDYLNGAAPPPAEGWEAFLPLRAHPARHTCALLPLQALRDALKAGGF